MRGISNLPGRLLDLLRRLFHRDRGHDHHERWPPLPPEFGETTDTGGGGGVYVYVRGELLVGDRDLRATRRLLEKLYPGVQWGTVDPIPLPELNISKLVLPEGAPSVPEIVDRLRYDDLGSSLSISPNHVLAWSSHPKFIPAGPPVPVNPAQPAVQAVVQAINQAGPAAAAGPVQVGVLDTGVINNSLPANRCTFRNPQDLDRLDLDGDGQLDRYAGHGTFVAGIVLRHTVNAAVTVRRVEPRPVPHDGYTTDQVLADTLRLWRLEPGFQQLRVLNLSIGGGTANGVGLSATRAALDLCRQVAPDLVIVAGAGNDNTSAPVFPAAYQDVVAVAAIHDTMPNQKTCFSNLGWWVDACAPGLRVVSAFLQWQQPIAEYPAAPAGCTPAEVPPWQSGNANFNMVAEWRGTSFAAPVVAAWIAHRIATGGVSGVQAVNDLRNGGLPGLGPNVTDLGRVVRPPF